MGDKVEYVTTYWVEEGHLVQRFDTLEGCDLIHERIVRCRDCYYADEFEGGYWCDRFGDGKEHVLPNGFCAWGKKVDDDEHQA